MPFQFSENRRERDPQAVHRGRGDDKHDGEHLRKLFVGGLSYETTKEELEAHFSEFGEIVDCVVMIYPDSKRSRGFGFVTFHSMTCVDAVQSSRPHYINDKEVETKRATPREKNNPRDSQLVVKKLFVGGIPEESTEDDIRTACEKHGNIVEVEIIKDRVTGKPRGFCFVTFDDYDPVDKICMLGWLQVLDKKVEVKKATPKENDRRDRFNDRRERGGGGGGGGGYFGGGDRRGDDRYGRQDSRDRYGGGDQRRERYRSRSPVRYDRYSSGRSSSAGGGGGGYSGGMGAGNYSQSSAPPDALANLTQLAPALASLGTLVGLLSNNSGGAANSGGSNALNQLVSALGSSAGGVAASYSGDQSAGGMAPSSYADRGDNNSGYGQGNYSSGYSSSYPSYGGGGGMMQQKDEYNR